MVDTPRTPLAYQAEDRSLLLPLYRRMLLEPLVPHLSPRIHPNTITHIGHMSCLMALLSLLALRPRDGWPLVLAALLLQLYMWCDNADGTHARRTGQSSPYGELLDHGLDILNVVYIALMSCIALALPPRLWVVVVLLVTGAAAVTYWEQAQTGVFRQGMMSQLESGAALTLVLCTGAVLGTAWWSETALAGVSVQLLLVLWPSATILFGVARAVARVARARGVAALSVIASLGLYAVAIAVAVAGDLISAKVAVVLAISGNVYFSMRMLSLRVDGKSAPRSSRALSFGTVGLLTIGAFKLGTLSQSLGSAVAPSATEHLDTAWAATAATVFGLGAMRDARRGIARAGKPRSDV
jgi:phosphatidylglycerophosphate synthase